MKTIHKYTLEITDVQIIELPSSSTILKIAEQRGVLCMWVELDTNNNSIKRHFRIIGTGHELEQHVFDLIEWSHIDTVLMANGLVWHIYETNTTF